MCSEWYHVGPDGSNSMREMSEGTVKYNGFAIGLVGLGGDVLLSFRVSVEADVVRDSCSLIHVSVEV